MARLEERELTHPLHPTRRPLTVLALAASMALTACAIAPLEPDTTARAPVLEGFGTLDWRIATDNADAQRLFTQGVLQAYAFNEKEAVRQFKAALAADVRCAMCAWGVAWQLGPNINAPERGDLTEARRYAVYALRHADRASPRDRALIEAMAVRYGETVAADLRRDGPAGAGEVCRSGSSGGTKAHPLDVAYAQRLYALVQATPSDPDLLSLWSEAAMVATGEDDWWNPDTGKPLPVIAEMVDRLERAQAGAVNHTGLNHYLIHAADSLPGAPRAVAAADRLGRRTWCTCRRTPMRRWAGSRTRAASMRRRWTRRTRSTHARRRRALPSARTGGSTTSTSTGTAR
jgi:hypothetical protein